jgi:hypothetical protein
MAQKKIEILFDINGKPIDVAIDKTLNLAQQVKELTKELRRTKEGTDEFRLLSNRLGEAQDGLAKTTAKSKDLFGSLSMLPGPVGAFFQQLSGSIELLKVFSSFTFKDLKFQFGEVADDIGDIGKNLAGVSKEAADIGSTVSKTRTGGDTDVKEKAAAAETAQTAAQVQQTAATNAQTTATAVNTEAFLLNGTTKAFQQKVTNDLISSYKTQMFVQEALGVTTAADTQAYLALDVQKQRSIALTNLESGRLNKLTAEYAEQGVVIDLNTAQIELNTLAEQERLAATNLMIDGIVVETGVTKGATAATTFFTQALKLIPFLAIIAAITALVVYWDDLIDLISGATDVTKAYGEAQINVTKDLTDFNKKLFEVNSSFKAAKEGVISKEKALKDYNDKLGQTIGYAGSLSQAEALLAANTKVVVDGIKLRAQAQVFYAKSAEASAKAVSGEGIEPGFWKKTFNLIAAGGNIIGGLQNNVDSYVNNLKENQDLIDVFAKEGDKLTEAAIENDKKLKKGLKEAPKTGGEKKDPLKEAQDRINANEALQQSEDELAEANRKKSEKVIQALREEQLYKDAENIREKQRLTDLQNVLDLFLKKKLISQKEYDKQKKALDTEANNLEKTYVSDKIEREKKVATEVEKIKKTNSDNIIKIDELYADEEVKAKKKSLQKVFEEFENEGKKKVKTYKDILDQLLKDEGITIEEYGKKLVDYTKLVDTEVANQKKEASDEENKRLKEERLKKLDDELRFLDIRKESVRQGTKEYYEILREITDKSEQRELEALDQSLYTTEEYEKRRTDIAAKYAKQRKDIKDQENAAMWSGVSQTLDALATIGNAIASGLDDEAKKSKKAFEERKKLQKATALISAASGIIQILTQPSTLPSPFDWIVKAANAVALGVATAVQIKKINETKFEGAQSSAPNYGSRARNYADGGMIGGRRHAQGGTMIEAEAGEAIMTRGAVTMFAPLLSLMNQAGGGTTFSTNMMTTTPDNPKTSNPTTEQNPMIIKTYVVSNELTTEAQKQARLKDLSTI